MSLAFSSPMVDQLTNTCLLNPIVATSQTSIVETVNQTFASVVSGDYNLVLNIPYGANISRMSVQSAFGTGTISLTKNGSAVSGLVAQPVSTSLATYYPNGATALVNGDALGITVATSAGIVGLSVSVVLVRGTFSTQVSDQVIAGAESGTASLVNGQTTPIVITFTSSHSGSYFPSFEIINLIDANPLKIDGVITAMSSTAMTIYLDSVPDSNNYVLRWRVE